MDRGLHLPLFANKQETKATGARLTSIVLTATAGTAARATVCEATAALAGCLGQVGPAECRVPNNDCSETLAEALCWLANRVMGLRFECQAVISCSAPARQLSTAATCTASVLPLDTVQVVLIVLCRCV